MNCRLHYLALIMTAPSLYAAELSTTAKLARPISMPSTLTEHHKDAAVSPQEAFFEAIRTGNTKTAATLIEDSCVKGHWIDLNAKDSESKTPLGWAIATHNPDLVDLLVLHNADLHAPCSNNTTPLAMAEAMAEYSKPGCVLHEDADRILNLILAALHTRFSESILGNPKDADRTIMNRPHWLDINAKDHSSGMTPLGCAIAAQNRNLVQLLVDIDDVRLDAPCSANLTPLEKAQAMVAMDSDIPALKERADRVLEIVITALRTRFFSDILAHPANAARALLDCPYWIDLNGKDDPSKMTLLGWAIYRRNPELVQLLVDDSRINLAATTSPNNLTPLAAAQAVASDNDSRHSQDAKERASEVLAIVQTALQKRENK
jgi:ankyrin repeat protein